MAFMGLGVVLRMLLYVYISHGPYPPGTGLVMLVVSLLIGIAWAVAYKRGHRAAEEDHARRERIEAQSRQRRANRR